MEDYRTGAQDTETQAAITTALLAYYTLAQVDALLGDYRTASAQDTQTQAAPTGRPGPTEGDEVVAAIGEQILFAPAAAGSWPRTPRE